MESQTRVYFTVDVECAEERHHKSRLQPAMGYDLRVWGHFENQSRPLGIELIMDELEARGFAGTFFVEPLGAHSFGVDAFAAVPRAMRARGHDVQLHLHPVQRYAFWSSRGEIPPSDDIADYPLNEQAALLLEGLDLLERAGVPRREICAYRAGNFGAGPDVWDAIQQAGLCLSSNYNPCYLAKNCRMHLRENGADLFRTDNSHVWELPITNLIQPNGHYRHLQLRATTLREMISALRQCRRLGIGHVCIVAHSFELFFVEDAERGYGRKDVVTMRRFTGLLDFLRDHSEFSVETLGQLAKRLTTDAWPQQLGAEEFPRETWADYTHRLVEQGVKRITQRLPVG